MQTDTRKCPICGREYTEPPALSRVDNTTEICPRCGTTEALQAAGMDESKQAEILAAIYEKGATT
jgi:ribosomal protein S27AE